MFTIIRKTLCLLSFKERSQLYLMLAALAGVALFDMAGIASIMPFMAVVTRPDEIQSNYWLKFAYDFLGFTSVQSFLFSLGLLVLSLLVVGNLFKALVTWFSLRYDNQLNYILARRLLASYLLRPYEFFLNRNSAEMGKNVLSEVRTVIAGILSPGMQVVSNALLGLFVLGLLMVVNPLIAITIALVLGGVYAVIYLIARNRLVRIGQTQIEANTMKYKAANEAFGGIKDLKILGREETFLDRFSVHALQHARANAAAGVISQLPRFALETIAFGGILMIVLHFLGSEQGARKIVPLLALYAFAGYRLLPALQIIFASISNVRHSSPALEVLYSDLMPAGNMSDPADIMTATRNPEPLPLTRELVLRSVTYCYPGANEPAIKDLTLSIRRNSTVGFVGATGSGKTTTVDVILGLLTPTSGRLFADATEISDKNLVRWQRNLGYVPQHIYLCDDTIACNIAFGVPVEEIDMECVIRAARIANLFGFVEQQLSDGFNTIIGERGVRLSGGQRQRIGIARALYRDPDVLIMDEATSALDGITEVAVMEAIQTLAGEKTLILIAHRLTTVRDCDVIYLMDHGDIISHGTYDELMGSSSWFRAAARTGTG